MKNIYKNLIAGLFLFTETMAHAQTPGFDDDVQDVPIDNWIVPMLIVGILFVFWVVRNKQNTIKQNR